MKSVFSFLILTIFLISCSTDNKDLFYQGFKEPPVESRPFVRWWWNGNHLNADEISRELDLLKEAGIGGVEINPIAMPENAANIGTQPIAWLSEEWNQLLALACQEAKERGMIADMIVGSGWPFGGEFLQPDEYTQRLLVNRIPIDRPMVINETRQSLLDKMTGNHAIQDSESSEIFFISLIPDQVSDTSEVIDLMNHFHHGVLRYPIKRGKYELVYGILQRGHRRVLHGALGASGHVMDHYSREVTLSYLNRLLKITEDTGIPLNELLRALFCDSIELAGSNWTDQFQKIFFETYGYDLKNYLPFVLRRDSDLPEYPASFRDQLRRARFDYNSLLVKVFLNNFTRTFQEFCTTNGLLCKYQAYGVPFLMGLLEGYMIPDIPESNNWIYSADMDSPHWTWNKEHGYMIWNHYAAAGGHLSGRKIISNEAMTNTRGVFKTSLEEIKQHDDMNFISGMNHSVLHGFNYSPPEAGFPGWVRYGTYFSPQNTWWPYFRKWTDYNARLSYVFQNSQPVKSIALLGPDGDIWSTVGLGRSYFHLNPWYLHELWQTLSQNGSSGEYVNQQVIGEATVEDGVLRYGPMQYQALWISSVESLLPETALAIQKYVENGGTLVLIDRIPDRSLSLQQASQNDALVESIFKKLTEDHPNRVFFVQSPEQGEQLMAWTSNLLDRTKISRQVKISDPDPALYQIHQEIDGRSIWFFSNTSREASMSFAAEFPTGDKIPWLWDPETGAREAFAYEGRPDRLMVTLDPLQSALLVFEPELKGSPKEVKEIDHDQSITVGQSWEVAFHHVDGRHFTRVFDRLTEFTSTGDSLLQSFAGQAVYETEFKAKGDYTLLRLHNVNKGVTEVYVNDQKVGERWYGNHTYDLEPFLRDGSNRLKIIYTTMLANYCVHLKDNPTAQAWTRGFSLIPSGIEGPVRLYAEK